VFSLYLRVVCHFSFAIKSQNSKPKPKIRLVQKIHQLLDQLKKRASQGDKESEDDLYFFRWIVTGDFQIDLSKKAKAGQPDSPPPIRTILEIADWAIPLLLWLTDHQRESVKKYARKRWAWPAYVHLLKREQARYETLLPKFNKTGTKIVKASPIELGSKLSLQLNANLTKGDFIFRIAANAINHLVQPEDPDFWHDNSWFWLPTLHKPLLKLKKEAYAIEANKFLNSLGKFTRKNWSSWKPVFETRRTFYYGLPEYKFELIPREWQSNLHICLQQGVEMQWFENFKKSKPMTAVEETKWLDDLKAQSKFYDANPPLQQIDLPEIREIVERKKTKRGKWIELKDEILKRIHNLAPPD
jgi:hypothetical protein